MPDPRRCLRCGTFFAPEHTRHVVCTSLCYAGAVRAYQRASPLRAWHCTLVVPWIRQQLQHSEVPHA